MTQGQPARNELRGLPTLPSRLIAMLVDMPHQSAEVLLVGFGPLVARVRVLSSKSRNEPLDPQRIRQLLAQILCRRTPGRPYHRKPAGHRLVDREPPPFATGRQDEAVGGSVQRAEFLRTNIRPEVDHNSATPVGQAKPPHSQAQ